MRAAPHDDGNTDKIPEIDVPYPSIPIFVPEPSTDQASRTVEEEIVYRQSQGIDTRTTSATPPIVPVPQGGILPWAVLAAGYLIFG
jgi:hypothetical protein